ncbi:MAG: hypothetical protein EBS84_19065 [Proteobacteria bacterium]|nr:hypothetical protein [Verrucomicrobiota bacterium]NBU11089.1 hypothetical protein [Pseudomonadota bacterium]
MLANFTDAAERTADGKLVAETRTTGFESYYAAVKQSSMLTKQAMARPLTAREHFDLSLSLFGTGRFAEAAMTAQLGMGQAKDDMERAAFFGVIAQSRGALGNYQEAAQAALEGHRLNPHSKELATMRVTYFKKTGNGAQLAAAEDALSGMMEGEPVSLPILVGAGLAAKWVWNYRKEIMVVLHIVGPPIVEHAKERWPQQKEAIEAVILTLKTMWTVAEKIESATPATR